jgi:PIN domain nuclease of toxin-antitoxin system
MKYLLDTNVFLQSLTSYNKLNQRAVVLLRDNSADLYISAVSSWEITIKTAAGKLLLPESPAEFVTRSTRLLSLQLLDVTHLHALAAGELPSHHRDPFDRMLVAQARTEGMVLLTLDRTIASYKVEHIYCGR